VNREATLARTSLVTLSRFDHPPDGIHRDPPEEIASRCAVAFVERGAYEMSTGRERHRFAPGMVFVTHPGMVYRCRHDEEAPTDTCLVVQYTGAASDEFLGICGTRVALWSTNRLTYARLRLDPPAARPADPLGLEVRAAELLGALSEANGAGRPSTFRAHQLTWYARRVDAARERIETDYAGQHTLASLARFVAMSPFHFARVFRELAGVPPHRLLQRVRLEQAARRLRDGMSVTDTCFDVGFSNLSHFIRLFRRAHGVSPSRFR
jgi:AraC family transcriptional regulator